MKAIALAVAAVFLAAGCGSPGASPDGPAPAASSLAPSNAGETSASSDTDSELGFCVSAVTDMAVYFEEAFEAAPNGGKAFAPFTSDAADVSEALQTVLWDAAESLKKSGNGAEAEIFRDAADDVYEYSMAGIGYATSIATGSSELINSSEVKTAKLMERSLASCAEVDAISGQLGLDLVVQTPTN